jgi:hypothetical protein
MPIQISEVQAYCALCGFDEPVTRHEILNMVQALDSEWLKHEGERIRAELDSAKRKGGRIH